MLSIDIVALKHLRVIFAIGHGLDHRQLEHGFAELPGVHDLQQYRLIDGLLVRGLEDLPI